MTNRLAAATSPYLLQHAENPVDWWEWGPEAFEEARRRDTPILLSVGYAACHWCHVMARESFADAETAALMNERFVNIKVDREERPDVDSVYMDATQAMTGHGGWPMTVFTTPAGEPFHCGTYFPPEPRHGMPAFGQVLRAVAEAWRERRADLENAAAEVVRRLDEHTLPAGHGRAPDGEVLHAAVAGLGQALDVARGGFGGAPKFPPSMTLLHLLRHHGRTGSQEALRIVTVTAEAMARGGIHDQLGGGFARYSVDADWVVPHFEKMLYDNALLLRAYTGWAKATGSEVARRVAERTAEWLLRDLRTAQGGFASALDADSEGAEGRYYVWTPAQLREVLGAEDATWAARVFGVTDAGTFADGASVLQCRADPEDPDRLERVRLALRDARAQRVPPACDDKVVAAWNGLAIAALAEAGAVFDRADLQEAATAAARLIVEVHTTPAPDGDRLLRTSRGGRPGTNAGVLEDYGDVAEGYLTLYATTGATEWLDAAGRLLDTVLGHFGDGAGGFHDTADDAEALMRRPAERVDNATPCGQHAAAGALLGYAAYTGSERHRGAAEAALSVVAQLGERAPSALGWGLAVAEALADGPREVAVVGPRTDPRTRELHRVALLATAPGVVVALGDGDPGAEAASVTAGHPALLAERPLRAGSPTAYVCRGFVCAAPTSDPAALAEQVVARRS